jgi:SprT protein
MVEYKNILQKYLPENSIDLVLTLFDQYRFHLKISKKRNSKMGDYRPPFGGKTHRISVNHDLNPYSFLITLIHEIAHLVVHENHKRSVSPHGKEWKLTYQFLLGPFFQRQVFPSEIQDALEHFFSKKLSTSRSDTELTTVLRKYDQPNGSVQITELPKDSLFKLADGRLFLKGEQLRKRYVCKCLSNRRSYLVSHLMEVYPVHYQYNLEFSE